MQYDNQDEKIGGGIITICVLYFIGLGLTILGSFAVFAMKDQLSQYGTNVSPTSIGIGLVISIIIAIGAILILNKSKLGIIIFYIGIAANLVNTIITGGSFLILSIIIKLVLPIIMAILLKNKKELFGFGNN